MSDARTVLGPTPFGIDGDLPTGLTVLEASAGTGKTYSLAGLVTRYVAETGLQASELCVVSFTEAATAELRGRIREKLVAAHAHLESGEPSTDTVVALLQSEPERRSVYLERLAAVLADFDTATISTIHGFCSRVLAIGAGSGVETTFTGDDSDIDEAVNDCLIARFGAEGAGPAVAKARDVADAVRLRLRIPDASLYVPADPELNPPRAAAIGEIVGLVDEVVEAVTRRRREQRRRTFDSLIVEARDLLCGASLDVTRAVLQQRFRVVMIDEFQDTDRVQWDIFRSAFCEGPRPATVVVVGDPKQSIYRFRSADLSAYLEARSSADAITSLDVNWRSDAALLGGLEDLFARFRFDTEWKPEKPTKPKRANKASPRSTAAEPPAAVPDLPPGPDEIGFRAVAAAPGHDADVLVDPGPVTAPLVLRTLDSGLSAGEAGSLARRDLVAEVVRMLHEVQVDDADAPGGRRRLAASDIGVLVRSNADAAAVVTALAAANVPAASSSNDSVLDSRAANQWRILLSALERPSSIARARSAALTWFVGMTPAELDAVDTEGVDGMGELVDRLRSWAALAAAGGLAALMAEMRADGLLERVLSRSGGERDLTDLDHVLELMQGVVGARPAAASALLAVLDSLADPQLAGEEAVAPEVLARRIDRDDDTVKVLTVHRAKGLEFPVVLCPTLWRSRPGRQGLAHAQLAGGRVIDTDCMVITDPEPRPDRFTEVVDQDKKEREAEDRRLLYVALTRARHRLVVWTSANPRFASAPLGELLAHACRGPVDLDALAGRSEGRIAAVRVEAPGGTPMLDRTDWADVELDVAVASRALDRTWYRWSFSSVKARMEALEEEVAAATAADLPVMGGVDEPSEVVPPLDVAPPTVTEATPLQGAPAGTAFGTLVHSVLERVDFAAPDLADELRERVAELLHYRALSTTPDALADGLLVALDAPLGGPMEERSLRQLTRADRLDELGFDLPLAGLDARTVAAVVARHLPADDRLRPWFDEAAAGALPVPVAGLLTGSIDLVARTTDGRYWLADYKTNLIPDGDYGPDALAAAMAHHGYPLQATLYLVALHRYLRWRLKGYDPDRHLAGAAYLFLRGMDPSGPRSADGGPGVIWWRPPTAAVEELDRLLATGVAA